MDTITDLIVYWFVPLSIAIGFWLSCGVLVTGFYRRRDRRRGRKKTTSPECKPIHTPKHIIQRSQRVIVRGYDSHEVFVRDTLERIAQLESQIKEEIREAIHRKANKW